MTDPFQIAAIGMADGQRRLEAISRNTAHAATAGYRRNIAPSSPFDAFAPTASSPPAARVAESVVPSFLVDTRPATMTLTGRALDMAIDADDQYFGLSDGSHMWLTRAGAFRLGDQGVLIGPNGLHVIGTQGDIHLSSSEVSVASDGRLLDKGEVVGALQLFRVDGPGGLEARQGAVLRPTAAAVPAAVSRVRGGMLEASNTDPAREMVDAIAVSRQFEALSRVVQGYDDALGQAIQKLTSL